MSESNKKRKHVRYFDGEKTEFQEVEPDATEFYNEPQENSEEIDEYSKKWFQMYDEHTGDDHLETVEMKMEELNILRKKASSCFENECHKLKKSNPSDNKWLLTAVEKGTSKDSANAGIVLVQSNPLSNLDALKKIVNMVNVKNKTSLDVIMLVAQLFMESLLPAYRKLRAIERRGNDWKKLKINTDQPTKDKILAYWHFENELKGYYGDFCNNLAQQLQQGKEANKLKAIHAAVLLLIHSPEREIQLLPMLINKFGDPNRQVCSKLIETLKYLVRTHSKMCLVIAKEIEKLLFRNNTTERGQHYALSFLSLIAHYCDTETSQILVRICLAFFKIKTESGSVNTKTMQRILACFRTVVTEASNQATIKKEEDLIDREVLEQLYRMIHLAQIETSLFAISLLLEVNIATKMNNSERYYNMVYKKMTDLDITKAKHKNINLYFNILHRSIDFDPNIARTQAFVKRLLQIGLYWPSNKACGALVLISKVLKRRPAMRNEGLPFYDKTLAEDDDKQDVKRKYNLPKVDGYDPYHRNPLFAGAQHSLKYELNTYREHFHPSVRVFADDVLNGKPMTYFGDPIEDFDVTRFLDRFSFKNPSKKKNTATETLQGSRKLAIKDLNDQNVVVEEKFLLEYNKRDKEMKSKNIKEKSNKKSGEEDDELSDTESVNDEEFDAYLDSLGAKAGKKEMNADIDDDMDFLGEINSAVKGKKSKKKKSDENDSDEGSEQDEWDVSDVPKKLNFDADENASDDCSISLDDEDEIIGSSDSADDASVMSFSDDDDEDDKDDDNGSDSETNDQDTEDDQPKQKKQKLSIAGKLKKRKSADMDSEFVDTEEFAEMLESNSKSKHHGTSDDIRNHDKSSDKQMKWESERMQDLSDLKKKRKFNSRGEKPKVKFGKKKVGDTLYKKSSGAGNKPGFKPSGTSKFKKSYKKPLNSGMKTKKHKQLKFSNKRKT